MQPHRRIMRTARLRPRGAVIGYGWLAASSPLRRISANLGNGGSCAKAGGCRGHQRWLKAAQTQRAALTSNNLRRHLWRLSGGVISTAGQPEARNA